MDNTRDLMDFNLDNLRIAAKLLLILKTSKDHTKFLGPNVCVELNYFSGYVFLIDSDFNVAMINPVSDALEDWARCPCGAEGFAEYLNRLGPCCKKHVFKSVF